MYNKKRMLWVENTNARIILMLVFMALEYKKLIVGILKYSQYKITFTGHWIKFRIYIFKLKMYVHKIYEYNDSY